MYIIVRKTRKRETEKLKASKPALSVWVEPSYSVHIEITAHSNIG